MNKLNNLSVNSLIENDSNNNISQKKIFTE